VHMAMLGAPIEGDDLYPQLRQRSAGTAEVPLQLLAQGLAFDDPLSGERRVFSSQHCLRLPDQDG